jgi:hypothetical protein
MTLDRQISFQLHMRSLGEQLVNGETMACSCRFTPPQRQAAQAYTPRAHASLI